jgi:hypothetical protein
MSERLTRTLIHHSWRKSESSKEAKQTVGLESLVVKVSGGSAGAEDAVQ